MVEQTIDIEVAYGTSDKQACPMIKASIGTTVEQAINQSGIISQFPEIDLANIKVGIFGKGCSLTKVVEQGDRVEIYRPLQQNPMDARRNRANK